MSRRVGLKRRFQELPHFGIFASGAVFCAVVGIWVSTAIGNPGSIGFHVRLLSSVAQKQAFDPWLQAIVIRIDGQGRFYLNGNGIPARRIPAALAGFFRTRANRVVYVEGALDSSFGDVVEACRHSSNRGRQCRAFDSCPTVSSQSQEEITSERISLLSSTSFSRALRGLAQNCVLGPQVHDASGQA